MDALIASYADSSSSDSDSDSDFPPSNSLPLPLPLPPPPVSLLTPLNSLLMPSNCLMKCPYEGTFDDLQTGQSSRVRSFPHVDGNYALHVYIPVLLSQQARKEAAHFLRMVSLNFPGLHVVDADIALENLHSDDQKVQSIALGREFHISLGRTVPIRVHQIDSVVDMLRQRLQSQKRYWIDFNNWEVFVNDDATRTFLSIEVKTGGLSEITKHIQAVNEVYRLHNLPEFYKDPRPHISVAWASGDVSDLLKRVVEEVANKHPTTGGSSTKRVFTLKFSGIECKIGNKSHKICKLPDN